jgi:hypothetical protein
VVEPDHVAALGYVAAERQPGEAVAVALPATAYLALGGRDGLYFLAGAADHPRVDRYTRLADDGRRTDYWAGADAIASTAALCAFLRDEPDAWLVVDQQRLSVGWAYAGPFADVLTGATREVYRARRDALVLRPLPPNEWASGAEERCRGSG